MFFANAVLWCLIVLILSTISFIVIDCLKDSNNKTLDYFAALVVINLIIGVILGTIVWSLIRF